MSELLNGKLIDPIVTQKIFTQLHKGKMSQIHAIVVHQTGAETSDNTFNSYKQASAHGAHFLIDTDGTIYQTALLTQKTHHVGKLKSRCIVTNICTKDELAAANAIYFKKGQSYSVRVAKLYKHEKSKNYPERYPMNDDSIGIEIVGDFDQAAGEYESVTTNQNISLKWLVNELIENFDLDIDDDVYRHPDVSYKKPTEASTAKWK